MSVQHVGLKEINGPLVTIDGLSGVSFDEIAAIRLDDGSERVGRVIELDGDKAVLQVFEGTSGISLVNTKTEFKGKPLEIPLSDRKSTRLNSSHL